MRLTDNRVFTSIKFFPHSIIHMQLHLSKITKEGKCITICGQSCGLQLVQSNGVSTRLPRTSLNGMRLEWISSQSTMTPPNMPFWSHKSGSCSSQELWATLVSKLFPTPTECSLFHLPVYVHVVIIQQPFLLIQMPQMFESLMWNPDISLSKMVNERSTPFLAIAYGHHRVPEVECTLVTQASPKSISVSTLEYIII